MHECPDCGQVCDCTGDDTWMDCESDTCEHECDPADLEELGDDDWDDERCPICHEYDEDCYCDDADEAEPVLVDPLQEELGL
jgi:hypothetical protein